MVERALLSKTHVAGRLVLRHQTQLPLMPVA
jgi:hypothetical protein